MERDEVVAQRVVWWSDGRRRLLVLDLDLALTFVTDNDGRERTLRVKIEERVSAGVLGLITVTRVCCRTKILVGQFARGI